MSRDGSFIIHKPDGNKFVLHLFWMGQEVYSMDRHFPLEKDNNETFTLYTCQTTLEKVLEFLGATIEEAAEKHVFLSRYLERHNANPAHYQQMADYIQFYEYVKNGGAVTSVEIYITDD